MLVCPAQERLTLCFQKKLLTLPKSNGVSANTLELDDRNRGEPQTHRLCFRFALVMVGFGHQKHPLLRRGLQNVARQLHNRYRSEPKIPACAKTNEVTLKSRTATPACTDSHPGSLLRLESMQLASRKMFFFSMTPVEWKRKETNLICALVY